MNITVSGMYKNTPILSKRERKIITLLADGHTSTSIGSKLRMTDSEVNQKIQKILHKQGFESHYQLISWAYREAIIT